MACTTQSNSHLRIRKTAAGYSREDNFIPPLHVHGTLDTQIIMGVNDESQLNLTGGVSLNKYVQWVLVKSVQNAETNNNWDKPAKDVIQKSDIIYIYDIFMVFPMEKLMNFGGLKLETGSKAIPSTGL